MAQDDDSGAGFLAAVQGFEVPVTRWFDIAVTDIPTVDAGGDGNTFIVEISLISRSAQICRSHPTHACLVWIKSSH